MKKSRLSLLPLLGAVCGITLLFQLQPASAAHGVGTLPQHVGLGMQRSPGDGWMAGTGTNWDYTYMYVNPGWEGDSTLISRFISEAAALGASGAVPTFTWYEAANTYFCFYYGF